ncbi:MAG: hypothetical protein N2746_06150 [Deltaproteobacteria bacterium]|nr:hypothetical protein [Deltaproteobacteria bacterium]
MPEDLTKGLIDTKLREDDRRIPLVEEIFQSIVKSIKTITIYKHNKDRFGEFVEPAFKLLEKFLKQNGALVIKVEPYSFKFMNAEVYKDTDQYSNISYRFFRDGVRRITFKEGLSLNEFLQFVLIVSGQSHISKQAEDTVSQLWLANLENIELTVIEGGVTFVDSEGKENETEKIELDKIVNFLEKKLSSYTNEVVGFARITAADIGMELESIQQIKGLHKKPELIDASTRQIIQKFFVAEDEFGKINRVKRILLAILKSNIDDVELQDVLENYTLIFDYILLLDDISKVAEFIAEIEKELQSVALSFEGRERISQLKQKIVQEINTDLRLERLFQILKVKKICDVNSLKTVVGYLNGNSLSKIPSFIEQIDIQENVALLIDALKQSASDYVDLWTNLLKSKKINLVILALDVIKSLSFEGKVEAVLPLLDSHVPQISLKALEIIAAEDSDASEKGILGYLERYKDLAKENILKVINLVNEDLQANIILRMLLDEDLKIDDSQRFILYTKMADIIKLPQVESYFDAVFNERGSIFTKGKIEEKKRLVIKAFVASPSLIVYQYLIKHATNNNCSDQIRKEILMAAETIKKRLQGK